LTTSKKHIVFGHGPASYFAPLFVSAWAAILLMNPSFWQLSGFDIPSAATFDDVDIGRRVSIYYWGWLLFALLFVVFSATLRYLRQSCHGGKPCFKYAEWAAFWGCMSLLASIINPSVNPMPLLFTIAIALFILLGVGRHWGALSSLSAMVSIRVFWRFCCVFLLFSSAGILPGLSASPYALMSFSGFGLVVFLLLKRVLAKSPPFLMRFRSLQALGVVLDFSLFIHVIAEELHISKPVFGPGLPIYWMVLSLLILLMRRIGALGKEYTLWGILLSVMAATVWVVRPEPSPEMFEIANLSNPLMRFFDHGEWPLVQHFSSHVLSDWWWPFLYRWFAGQQAVYPDVLSWLPFQHVVHSVMLLFALRFFFNSKWWALGLLLLLPIDALFPYRYIPALLGPVLLWRWCQRPVPLSLHVFLGYSVVVCLWSMELAFSYLLSMVLLSIVLFLHRRPLPLRSFFLHLLWHLAGIALITLILFVWQGASFSDAMANVLAYAGTAQAHGWPDIAPQKDRFFAFHYFLFPVLSLLISLYVGFRLVANNKGASKNAKAYLFALFCLVFYFVNLQRGLVRHSLFAGYDHITHSLFFAGLLAFLYPLFNARFRKLSVPLLLTAVFLIMVASKMNDSFLSSPPLVRFFDTGRSNILSSSKWVKNGRPEVAVTVPGKLRYVLTHCLPSDETFFDFSNNPHLHYITGKPVLGYFNQPLQNSPHPNAQKRLVEGFGKQTVSLVVFQKMPAAWGDMVDGVPNTVRYPIITSYVYAHYKPLGIIDGFWVWGLKGRHWDPVLIHVSPPDSVVYEPWNLKSYPGYLATLYRSEGDTKNPVFYSAKDPVFSIPDLIQNTPGDFHLRMFLGGKEGGKILFRHTAKAEYLVPLSLHPFLKGITPDSVIITHEGVDEQVFMQVWRKQ
jgi:hypothetical protein